MKRTLLVCMLVPLALGCARLEIRQAKPSDTEGLRFYRPWPYLWITVNEKGKCVPSITYLPNTSQEYLIIPHSGFGSMTLKASLRDGWNLISFDSAVDTKTSEVLNAVGGLLGKLAPAGKTKMEGGQERTLSPGLYRFDFDEKGFISDMVPIFQVSDAEGKPIACPALIGVPDEEAKPPAK